MTPTEERIKPRVDDDNRQRLSDAFTAILQQHAKDPIPAFAIKELVQATGDEMLTDLTIRLRELSSALPPLNAEDHEFETLEKRFANDHFGNSMENKDGKNKEDYARLKELRDKREFLPAAILRTSLSDTLTKLQLSTNAAELKKAVKENGPQSQWALNQFRRLDPNAWSEIIAGQFGNADVESRRAIFSTLAAGSPLAAKKLIEDITPTERFDLIIEIANYHQQQTADSFVNDIPDLMKLIRDRNQNYLRRCSAMPLLTGTKLPPETLKEFTSLLIAEVRNPQQGEYGMGTLDSAITALSMLPDAASHFDLISTLPGINDRSFSLGFEAILRVTKDRPDRQKLLADFIRPRFTRGNGMMNDVFLAALANDLRNLAPEISAFASENPSVENGDGADYSGGSFETPIGQHYHIAREITALWSENDPTTLGRMWIYFVAAHAYSFSQQNQALRDHAAEKIHGLHRDQLGEEINEAIALIKMTKYDSASELWLRDLGRNQ